MSFTPSDPKNKNIGPLQSEPKNTSAPSAKGKSIKYIFTSLIKILQQKGKVFWIKHHGWEKYLFLQTELRRWQTLSFSLVVILPCFLGSFYYTFIASDRYVSGAGFAVRGMNANHSTDVIGAFTGLASSGSTNSDSYIILKYLKSRDLLDQIEQSFDFRGTFSHKSIDILSRLDPNLEIEKIVDYWKSIINTSYEPSSGIITFEVEGFTREDAKRIAEIVMEQTQALINKLSEKARKDSVVFAENEVKRSESRLREALKQLRIFREEEQSIDPAASAKVQINILGALEQQLLDIRARMSALSKTVDADAPSLKALRRQAEALERQIEEKKVTVSTADAGQKTALSGLLAAYESLEVEKNFAEKAYALALSSLEKARVEADRQQRYFAVYSLPSLPEYPIYPQRLLNIFLIIIISLSIWGIGILIVYSVRDHLS